MDRAGWLKKIRAQIEALYDHLAPRYWTDFGMYANEAHLQFIKKLVQRLGEKCYILDAACGAGRYDGLLLEAGHSVLGIDQSICMLEKARQHFPQERFPQLTYARIGLQEMAFHAQFDGAICVDALEHVFPEDWPLILGNFHTALKPGGMLYFSLELLDSDEVSQAYAQARARGLPVVFGELADRIDDAYAEVMSLDWQDVTAELAGQAAYHFYPPVEQVFSWLEQVELSVEEQGLGDGYAHFLVRKQNNKTRLGA